MEKQIKHVDLSSIKDPSFLKDLSFSELNILSDDIRNYLIKITSSNGGHLSSNLGVVEATIALCRVFDFTKDKIIFDVGHQCYTYKLLTGRNLENLRKEDGVSGFQKTSESIYDHYEAGHSSTSISAAMGMAAARDLSKQNYHVVSFIGDSSIVSGLAMEAINNLCNEKHKTIIVLNDNGMSISSAVGGFSKLMRGISTSTIYQKGKHFYKRVTNKTKFGRWVYDISYSIKNFFKGLVLRASILDALDVSSIGPIDGHNIKRLEKAFIRAKRADKSVIVLIKTIKGRGYKYSENDQSGKWHGISSFNIETGEVKQSYTWSDVYAEFVSSKMNENEKVITIYPGTGYGSSLSSLKEIYPSRVFDVGIAEEHAFTFASGLSISGYHPIISIYSTFLQRAYDELSHDLARMNLNATILIDRAGLVGSDGETHQGLYDEAFLNSIPNVTITCASDKEIAKALFDESFDNHGVFAIRYPRENYLIETSNSVSLKYGDWIKQQASSSKLALVSTGPIVNELKEACKNEKVTLYNAIYLRPINEKWIKELLSYNKVIIYDPYGTETGFASYLSSLLVKEGYKGVIVMKAIPNAFIKQASILKQREKYNLSVEDIVKLVKE